jgi:hypothetical protein
VITEGLLIYLPEQSVIPAGARELHDPPRARWWLTDLAVAQAAEDAAQRWAPAGQQDNAPFVFGPAEGSAWFSPTAGTKSKWRSSFAESLRIKRTMRGGARVWRLLDKLQSPRAPRGRAAHVRHPADGQRGRPGRHDALSSRQTAPRQRPAPWSAARSGEQTRAMVGCLPIGRLRRG